MPVVSGALTDFQIGALGTGAILTFTPSGVGIGSARLYATRPNIAVPDTITGLWSIALASTDGMLNTTWYTISIQWLDSTGNYIGKDFLDAKLFVPSAGGTISDLLVFSYGGGQVWVGETDNPNYRFWYQPSTALLRS
jgi:hypothetical protein